MKFQSKNYKQKAKKTDKPHAKINWNEKCETIERYS